MIGNDIIDLELAQSESNWQRPGFLQKLFTTGEQKMILEHPNPETAVWILWSIKESAYKIYNRMTGQRAFIPHRIKCQFDSSDYSGQAELENTVYFTKTYVEGSLIHTIAVLNPNDFQRVRDLMPHLIKKDINGLPYSDALENKYSVSVSNHGRFIKNVGLA